jgi:hypothetical protein
VYALDLLAVSLKRPNQHVEPKQQRIKKEQQIHTFLWSLNPTCPTAILPSFLRFDHGVYTIVTLSFLFPIHLSILTRLSPTKSIYRRKGKKLTFDTVRLGQLRAVHEQLLGHLLPVLALWQPHVDMRRRQIVRVEPHILVPAVCNQLFICRTRVSKKGFCMA